MGRHHARNYAAMPDVELVAVNDIDPVQLSACKDHHDVAVYTSLDRLLAHDGIDAVSVAAPTSTHFDITRRLLTAGLHVLVEKPLVTEIAQAEILRELCTTRGLVLQVGHITRFYHAVRYLCEHVTAPFLIKARRLNTGTRSSDVGAILDLMIHDIDIVLSLVRSPVSHCEVEVDRVNGSGFEDVASAQIHFDNGCEARLVASRRADSAERTLVVSEPERTWRLDFNRFPHTALSMHPCDRQANGDGDVADRLIRDENPLLLQLQHFIARICGDAQPIGTLEDDVEALRVANRLRAQLEPVRPLLQPKLA